MCLYPAVSLYSNSLKNVSTLLLNVSLTQKGHIETVLAGHLFAWCYTGTLSLAQLECPTQSQYTDTGPTSLDTNLIMPTPSETAARVPIFKTLVCLERGGDSNSRPPRPQADALTTRLRGLVQIHWINCFFMKGYLFGFKKKSYYGFVF